MWKHSLVIAKAALAAAVVLLATPQTTFAQHRGGGGGAMHGGSIHGGGLGGPIRGGGVIRGGGIFYGGLGYGYYGYPGYYDYGPYYYDSPYYYAPPVPYYQAAPLTVVPGSGYQSNYPPTYVTDNSAMVQVLVPGDAQVWFDGAATQQTGSDRLFTTPPLTPGKAFSYEIRATWMVNGAPTTQTRQVQVEAGKRALVNFMGGGSGE